MATGRPSDYSDENAIAICQRISSGLSFKAACEGIAGVSTAFAWLASRPSFREMYTRARETRADTRFEKIDDVVADMRAGIIDSQMARVEIDAIKWQASKESAVHYGDKVTQEHTGGLEIRVTRVARD